MFPVSGSSARTTVVWVCCSISPIPPGPPPGPPPIPCLSPPDEPRNASGAALGVVGIASYIGAGLQDVMSGVLIEGNKRFVNGVEVYDFTYINWFWIGAALLSVFFALLVWNAKPKEVD